VKTEVKRVAIVGGGAAGSALAFHLASAGLRVVFFDRPERPPLVVGESMIPAVVPFLREFGIEEEVAGFGTFKPGASFIFNSEENLSVTFSEVRHAKTTYAYNVPRKELDAAVRAAAVRAGAHLVEAPAQLEPVPGSDRVRLSPASRAEAEALLSGAPDLIVDASGRARVLPKLLGLPYEEGPRKDVALFAHCQGVDVMVPGNIHVDILERGWAWRIPVPGRVSVGFVMDAGHIKSFGDDNEERFDRVLDYDPMAKAWGSAPSRITGVTKYNNYQLVSKRSVGDGWVLVGDAFGFIDPVFSSGTLLAYHSAKQLSQAILAGGSRKHLDHYALRADRHIRSWQRTIDHFYNGRLLTLFRVGEYMKQKPMGGLMDLYFRKYLPRVFTGEGSDGIYSPWLVDFMCRHGIVHYDPDDLRIR